ncbi:SH3 domain-containing GRB2-like protein B1 [Caenorhabditis elegans]|uniref:SH3 domain-containing GRB2-like protein B1 n=1 Tax=Caenorhabditis elegans TaxID=6239 RepID=L8E817_CAEEL|nr:SH3 domain-containing GRB2-like protein B1 [Caenorhabditis elegans]CCQ25695.1 SH3 domain-containing GRB2-like protein B1 [Caenorhabditis elegans]|eukprot:NP_001263954.1 Uncharacterized protein CELE_F35A5.8 [Caenorhabditis elegans]
MDFNFKKIASDAGGFFSRAKQLTEETFLKAERTELDSHFENLLQRADKTEDHTRRLLSAIEGYLQPNPTVRMEEVFYEKLELKKDGAIRQNNLEQLSTAMTEAGEQFGETTPYGSALLKVAQTENRLGQAERELCGQAATNTLLPIRRFLEGDMKTIQKERKVLNSKRLDLDACKSRLKKAKTVDLQTVAEADVRVAQAEFDKQSEITKLLLEGIQTAHNNQLKCLRDFVEAQMSFYAQSHQLMADLQRELSGTMSFRGSSAILVNNSGDPPNGRTMAAAIAAAKPSGLLPDDLGTKQAKVIMDYDAVLPQEISVTQNDILIVYRLPGMDAEYVMAEKGGKRGKLPVSYIELL